MSPAAAGTRGDVLVVLHGEMVGGASLSILRAAPALTERGWNLEFWAPGPGPLHDEIRRHGYEPQGMPAPFIGYSVRALRAPPGATARLVRAPSYFHALSKLLRSRRFAVVHLNSIYTTAEAMVVRAHRVPALMHVHEMIQPNVKGAIARRAAHGLAAVVAGVSQAGSRALSMRGREVLTIYESAPAATSVPRPRRIPT